MPGPAAGLISFEGFGKSFEVPGGTVHAARDVNLTVDEGEFVTLVGPSGCGKSTLLNAVAGLFPPAPGPCAIAASRSTATTARSAT